MCDYEPKDTEKLMQMIQESTCELNDVLDGVEPYMTLPPVQDYLQELFNECDETAQDVFEMIGVERTSGHRIMTGNRRPSRNVLLRIAFVLKLSVAKTQCLLKSGERAVLYPRVRRDALLIYCLSHENSLAEVEEKLNEIGETSLYVRC